MLVLRLSLEIFLLFPTPRRRTTAELESILLFPTPRRAEHMVVELAHNHKARALIIPLTAYLRTCYIMYLTVSFFNFVLFRT